MRLSDFKIAVFILAITLLITPQLWGESSIPRFMLLIDEKNMGTYSMGDTERVITQILVNKGAEVIDSELIKTNINRDKALQAMTSGPEAAAALGLQFGADIIIIGRSIAKGSPDRIKDTSFRSYSATVSLKAIRTDTSEILCGDTGATVKIHVDDIMGGSLAIQEATRAITDRLLQELLVKWADDQKKGKTKIQLIVGDVTQVWQVAALKKMLREQIKEVEEVIQKSFVSGIAIFEIHVKGTSQALAEALTLATPQYFRIKILSITNYKLDAKLVEIES